MPAVAMNATTMPIAQWLLLCTTGAQHRREGLVAVRKADEPCTRKGKPAPSHDGQRRRGRPPKRRERDAAEIATLRDLAAGES
jgi:hypothetical protein